MSRKKKKDRNDLTKDILKRIDLLFSYTDQELRMSYVCAVVVIQTTAYIMIKNNKNIIPIERINRWFINEYAPSFIIKDKNIDFDYENIAQAFLKSKCLIDFKKNKDALLQALNEKKRLNKEPIFLDWDKYCEYIVNNGFDDNTSKRVYAWITNGDARK